MERQVSEKLPIALLRLMESHATSSPSLSLPSMPANARLTLPASPPLPFHLFPCMQLLSAEFVYLLTMTVTGTWFGISVFYTILSELLATVFAASPLLQSVSASGGWLGGYACERMRGCACLLARVKILKLQ
jgi:hypothetical protein